MNSKLFPSLLLKVAMKESKSNFGYGNSLHLFFCCVFSHGIYSTKSDAR